MVELRDARRMVRLAVQQFNFQDHENGETVNTLTTEKLHDAVPTVDAVHLFTEYDQGEVLTDKQGGGSFQIGLHDSNGIEQAVSNHA